MTVPTQISDNWQTTAPTYSTNVARTSSVAAASLVTLASHLSPIGPSSRTLDNGAGTGAITLALSHNYPSTSILATDASASMLQTIDAQMLPNVSTRVLDARSLSKELEKNSFSHVFTTFMLQTIQTPLEAVNEMHTVLLAGGVIGIALWAQRNDPFDIWERACQTIDSSYKLRTDIFDDPHAWRSRAELEKALKQVGFGDVSTEEITMPFPFADVEAYLKFWFGAKNPAAEKCMGNWTGNMDKAREAVERVVRDEYANGKDVKTWAVLGVGKK